MTVARLLLLLTLVLPAALTAQSQSGRHFQRASRLPVTPAAGPVVEATSSARVAPLRKLRSGRPWPRHHFGRLPPAHATVTTDAVEASARRAPAQRRGFWRERR